MNLLIELLVLGVISSVVSSHKYTDIDQTHDLSDSHVKSQNDQVHSEILRKCIEHTNIPLPNVKKLQTGNFFTPAKEEKFFVYCMMRKLGIMSNVGHFVKAKFQKATNKTMNYGMQKVFDDCSQKASIARASEEQAWFFTRCYMRVIPDAQIL